MSIDRRGGIGFMEAIAGTMAVCIALTCFTAFLSSELTEREDIPVFDWTYITDIELEDNGYSISLGSDLGAFIEEKGLNGVRIAVSAPERFGITGTTVESGNTENGSIVETRLLGVPDGTGRTIPTFVEVRLFL